MSLIRSLVTRTEHRASTDMILPFDQWASYLNVNSFLPVLNPLGGKEEIISDTFGGLVQGAYKSNGIVFACELARIMLFSEARFQFRRRQSGRPGELFGTEALRLLEEPWPGGTTGDLLTRNLQHADFGGTGFTVRRGNRLRVPRPDWITMVLGSQDDPEMSAYDIDAELIGIIYHPGGRNSGERPVPILVDDVAVFAPIPDPVGKFRGIPWLTPIVNEIMADKAATSHKLKFFENGATPQIIVSIGGLTDPKKFREWVEVLEQDHKGVTNAYRTLYLAAGSQANVVGKDLQQLDFKATQGAGETRIASAANVPPVVVGLSEGLQGSSLNAGNFASSMRRFADIFARPNWRNFAGSIARIIDVPAGAELWYDDRDIPALKDDIKDAAEVQYREAASMRTLYDAGWKPDSIVAAVRSGDWTQLVHSGLPSVQNQPAGNRLSGDTANAAVAALLGVPLLASGDEIDIRCSSCDKLVGKRTAPGGGFEVKCRGCGTLVAA